MPGGISANGLRLEYRGIEMKDYKTVEYYNVTDGELVFHFIFNYSYMATLSVMYNSLQGT